jgi:hypothetical protein
MATYNGCCVAGVAAVVVQAVGGLLVCWSLRAVQPSHIRHIQLLVMVAGLLRHRALQCSGPAKICVKLMLPTNMFTIDLKGIHVVHVPC